MNRMTDIIRQAVPTLVIFGVVISVTRFVEQSVLPYLCVELERLLPIAAGTKEIYWYIAVVSIVLLIWSPCLWREIRSSP